MCSVIVYFKIVDRANALSIMLSYPAKQDI
jgi:hypothetical protein